MGNIFFTSDEQIEMFIFDYLDNLNFQNKNFRKRYFTPLINHFDFFHKIILKILKRVESKQKINLICNGLFILAQNINFILGNKLGGQLVEIIKNLDVNKRSILKSLILFSGVVLSSTNTYELTHRCNLSKFKNNFKKVLKDFKIHKQLKTINNWSSFSLDWNYIFKINHNNLRDPKGWFLTLIE